VWQVNGRRSPRIAISPTTSTASSAPQQDFRGPSLAALQAEGPDNGDAHLIEPLIEDDPRSFDLVPATTGGPKRGYNIEDRAALLTSGRHLQTIFDDPRLYKNFVSWIQTYRADSVPRLTIYRQAKKAIQAIKYSNAITSSMMSVEGRKFTEEKIEETTYPHLEELAKRAFDELVVEDFPAYICSIWVPIIAATVHQRINGALPDSLKQASEGLAEVFCLTDPRQKDDPIVLASKEFTTTTQYGMNFICGQTCRFLQGSGTDPNSVRRVRAALKAQREHSELFLNYRRDGSPFMNLCLLVPLTDFDGNLKYFLGAQVDVSGLLRSCAGFESFARTVRDYEEEADGDGDGDYEDRRSVMTTTANTSAAGPEFLSFAEMLDGEELKTVRRYGGAMHKGQDVAAYADGEVDYYQGGGRRRGMSDATSISSLVSDRPRMLLVDRNEAAWSSRNVRPHRIGDGAYRDAPSPNRAQPQQRSAEEAKIKMNRQLDTMYKDVSALLLSDRLRTVAFCLHGASQSSLSFTD
jgi:PAS domain-containing protein